MVWKFPEHLKILSACKNDNTSLESDSDDPKIIRKFYNWRDISQAAGRRGSYDELFDYKA